MNGQPTEKVRVMVVEDEAIVQLHLCRMLTGLGFEVVGGASSSIEALALAEEQKPELVLMDIELQGGTNGIETAHLLNASYGPAIVFLTAYADEVTVQLTETVGAVGYIVKPYSRNEVRAVLSTAKGLIRRLAAAGGKPMLPIAGSTRTSRTSSGFHGMVGESPIMQSLFDRIADVAPLNWTILIEGETGSGKELAARALHAESQRAQGPFIAVNCAGLTESLLGSQIFGHKRGTFTGAVADQKGFFEAANGGTLFLDEVADISASAQQALLRVLDDGVLQRVGETLDRQVDVRVISATQRDLAAEVISGKFRADLLYRLRAVRVGIAPLRQRGDDIILLARKFLAAASAQAGLEVKDISEAVQLRFAAYSWPGNVRELRHVIEHGVLACRKGTLHLDHLPPEIQPLESGMMFGGQQDEKAQIQAALAQCQGNRAAAARLLGISRATLYRRFAQLKLDPESF